MKCCHIFVSFIRPNTFPDYQLNADLIREVTDFFSVSAPPVLVHGGDEEPVPEIHQPHSIPVVVGEFQDVEIEFQEEEPVLSR